METYATSKHQDGLKRGLMLGSKAGCSAWVVVVVGGGSGGCGSSN